MSVRVSYSKQFIFGILLVLALVASIEIAVRIYIYEHPPGCSILHSDAYENLSFYTKQQICQDYLDLNYNFYPELYIKPDQNFKTIHINSDGFRGAEITKQKPANTFRVIMVGASTTFGWGATSDNTTIPAFLQKDFDNKNLDVKVQVINAGVFGAISEFETEYIKNKIIEYQPDLIIVYDGYNELSTNEEKMKAQGASFIGRAFTFYKQYFFFYKTPIYAYQFLDNMFNHDIINLSQITDSNEMKVKAFAWEERWNKICELGKKDNFETLIILQPFLGTGNKTLSKYEKDVFNTWHMSEWLSPYQYYYEELPKLNDNCSETADLRGIFDNVSDPLYHDRAHVSDQGNKIVADKIFELSMHLIKK